MAFKTFEFRRMGLFERSIPAGAVTFHAWRSGVELYIPVNDIVGNARITLS